MGPGIPPEFPGFLCPPEEQPGVQDRFDRYIRPGNLTKHIDIDATMYGLMIHPDNQRVLTHPWIGMLESLKTPKESQVQLKEAAAQWSLEIPGGDQEGVSTAEAHV